MVKNFEKEGIGFYASTKRCDICNNLSGCVRVFECRIKIFYCRECPRKNDCEILKESGQFCDSAHKRCGFGNFN